MDFTLTPELKSRAEYLGDGAYVTIDDHGQIWVFTHNGMDVLSAVSLDVSAMSALAGYAARNVTRMR